MEAIKKVVELYVEATRTGNVKLLRCLFHENAIMSGNLGEMQMVIDSPEHFFNDIEGKVASDAYRYEIYGLLKCGEIGTARLREYNLMGQDFVNLFQLQRVQGEWKIISKLFTSTKEGVYESL
jgi:mRNA degradation ribonuclease J1/J2